MGDFVNIPEIFGSDVFNEATMRKRLNSGIFDAWKQCIENGTSLPLNVADEIATSMKQWAIEKGATHYTHWFQPMTGITAEKHDSFITPDGEGNIAWRGFKGNYRLTWKDAEGNEHTAEYHLK